jgi:major vault protein
MTMRFYFALDWLLRSQELFHVMVQVQRVVTAVVLDENSALHIKALQAHTDQTGVSRGIGEQWLVTRKDAETWLEDVPQCITQIVSRTVLTNKQYVVVADPVQNVDGKAQNQLGERKLVTGPASFFLQPGESLADGN